MTLQVPAYAIHILNGGKGTVTLLLVAFSVGVGAGSLLCERMSGGRVELGLVPFGSIGLSLFAVDLYFAQPVANTGIVHTVNDFVQRDGSLRILFDLTMLGAFGGFYSVPLYAMVQERANRQQMSRIIAANNIINSLFMVSAAGVAIGVLSMGYSIPQLFLVLAALNALVAIYIYTLLPEFLMRFLAWILINILYRIKTTGRDNIPDTGPAVIVCNHVSFSDALILGGSIRRPVRFVMYYKIFQIPILSFLFRTAKAIPIASAKEDKVLMDKAFDQIDAELEDGNMVCIFPEGAITNDGEVHQFRTGVERVLERRPVPVIPIGLNGLWGSWFSSMSGGGLRRVPGRLFARVNVRIGPQVAAANASAERLELLVRTLRGDRR